MGNSITENWVTAELTKLKLKNNTMKNTNKIKAVLAGLILLFGLNASDIFAKVNGGETMQEKLKECAALCEQTAKDCDACAIDCKGMKGGEECVRLSNICAEECRKCAAACKIGGETAKKALEKCAAACDACNKECEKHETMKSCHKCAESCEKCAKECRDLNKKL